MRQKRFLTLALALLFSQALGLLQTGYAKDNEEGKNTGPFTGKGPDALSFYTTDFSRLQYEQTMYYMYQDAYKPPPQELVTKQYVTVQTEADFCYACVMSQLTIPPLKLPSWGDGKSTNATEATGPITDAPVGGIPLSLAATTTNMSVDESMKDAIKDMCEYVKKNSNCQKNSLAIVSDVSRGSNNIRTVFIDTNKCDQPNQDGIITEGPFATGGGVGGVGNVPQSKATPPGYFQLTAHGLNTRKKWPTCGGSNSDFNYFLMEGQGCKYNVRGESCQNTNARRREILYHTWARVGSSTWGCTGVSTQVFCKYGKQVKNACLYNYTGR